MSGETVAFTLPGKGGTTKTLGTAKATKSGAVGPIKSSVPANEPFGPQTITATGGTSDRAGATSIVVSNNSPQLGYTPQRFGFEPNDTVISMHQAVGASYFSPAWSFDASGAIDTPPAVDLGVAYFGDALGDFYAVSVSKGTSLWHESIGSAIDSSPAVDKGDVFFGDKAGSVVALNASTGAPVWSTPLKGSVNSSPAVSGGVVYIVDVYKRQELVPALLTWTPSTSPRPSSTSASAPRPFPSPTSPSARSISPATRRDSKPTAPRAASSASPSNQPLGIRGSGTRLARRWSSSSRVASTSFRIWPAVIG